MTDKSNREPIAIHRILAAMHSLGEFNVHLLSKFSGLGPGTTTVALKSIAKNWPELLRVEGDTFATSTFSVVDEETLLNIISSYEGARAFTDEIFGAEQYLVDSLDSVEDLLARAEKLGASDEQMFRLATKASRRMGNVRALLVEHTDLARTFNARVLSLEERRFAIYVELGIFARPLGTKQELASDYWRRSLWIMIPCLVISAFCSFGFGILLRPLLEDLDFFGVDLGFWFAQQGSIIVFILVVIFHTWKMNRLDREYGLDDL